MATYEGKWRCTRCSEVNRGRNMDCSGCGTRRGADVVFFLDDEAPPVVDEARLREANDGPDWLCETCGGSNRFKLTTCQPCGAARGNSSLREVLDGSLGVFSDPQSGAQASDSSAAGFSHNGIHTAVDWQGSDKERSPGTTNHRGEPDLHTTLAIISVIIIGTILVVLLTISPGSSPTPRVTPETKRREATLKDIELVVLRAAWRRSIEIEEYRRVTSEDWEDELPEDAKVISRRQDIHHHDRVKTGSHIEPEYYTERVRTGSHTETEYYTEQEQSGTESYRCGTRNLGNGYFEDVYCTRPDYRTVTKTRSRVVDDYQTVTRSRDKVVEDFKDVPVYRTKVSYTAMRWVPSVTLVAEGSDLKPHWPKVVPRAKEREGRKVETYWVFFRDAQGKKLYERKVGADEFALFTSGATCRAQVDDLDRIVNFTRLPGQTQQ